MATTPDHKAQKLVLLEPTIKVCRDFYCGALAVLNKTYLPKWDRETDEGYYIRKLNTNFPNLFSPIITVLNGLITKKEPVTEGFENFPLNDIDGKGNSLSSFIKMTTSSSLVAGAEFVAVQSDTERGIVFFKRYIYEQLVSYQITGNVLSQIVFKETIEVPDGEFGNKNLERFIIFRIGGGQVWYSSGGAIQLQEQWENTLTEIPVVLIATGKEVSAYEYVPRLYDVAILNRVLLSLESHLANVLRVIGTPVPLFWGKPSDTSVTVGVDEALVFEDKTKEGFMYEEARAYGVDKLQDKIKAGANDIDKLSFNLLSKDIYLTVVDAQENQDKSTSFLTLVAEELEVKVNKLFEFMSLLSGVPIPADAKVLFKKDFDDLLFTDMQLKSLVEMVKDRIISRDTLWNKLRLANILPKDFDAALERENLEVE